MRPKLKPIATYCKQEVPGWDNLQQFTSAMFSTDKDFTCIFLRQSDGIQFLASVKDLNPLFKDPLHIIHVSLAPVRGLRTDWTDEEHGGHIFDISTEVINSFFPGRRFTRKPDDLRNPHVKHYFSTLENNE